MANKEESNKCNCHNWNYPIYHINDDPHEMQNRWFCSIHGEQNKKFLIHKEKKSYCIPCQTSPMQNPHEEKKHKPMCKTNLKCSVIHADGICDYSKCDCGADEKKCNCPEPKEGEYDQCPHLFFGDERARLKTTCLSIDCPERTGGECKYSNPSWSEEAMIEQLRTIHSDTDCCQREDVENFFISQFHSFTLAAIGEIEKERCGEKWCTDICNQASDLKKRCPHEIFDDGLDAAKEVIKRMIQR